MIWYDFRLFLLADWLLKCSEILFEAMQAPSYTLQEDLRQQAVDSYHIVDTEPEEQFDNLTELAIQICGVQHALLTFLDKDRNWYKSNNNVPFTEAPRSLSFCGHLIHNPHDIMIV